MGLRTIFLDRIQNLLMNIRDRTDNSRPTRHERGCVRVRNSGILNDKLFAGSDCDVELPNHHINRELADRCVY